MSRPSFPLSLALAPALVTAAFGTASTGQAGVLASVRLDGGTLVYAAHSAQQNNVTIETVDGLFIVRDTLTDVSAGDGCVRRGRGFAECTGPVQRIRVIAGDGDDVVRISGATPTSMDGGAGNDVLIGGDGKDFLDGGLGADYLSGGDGNDTLRGSSLAEASPDDYGDTLVGGPGRLDSADYSTRTERVRLSLNGMADDGGAFNERDVATEADNIATDVEKLVGGQAADILTDSTAGGGANVLEGQGGNDVLRATSGSDQLNGGVGEDSLIGGDGADELFGGPGDDALDGGEGSDRLFGEAGADTLLGGDGFNNLFGGNGPDRIWGGAAFDSLNGGRGDDVMFGRGNRDGYLGGLGYDVCLDDSFRDYSECETLIIVDKSGTPRTKES